MENLENLLLLPPIAFLIMAALVGLQSLGFNAFALKAPKGKIEPEGKFKAYACGEDVGDHRAQPDYAQFFPFAFFFTIVHVVALVVTTLPTGSMAASALAVGFLLSTSVAVYVLFRR